MRRSSWVLALALGVASAGAAAAAGPVVLVSVDGMLPAYYLEADALGLRTPHLRALVREGTAAAGVTSVLPSLTYPAHTTLVTGVTPRRHGIAANNVFDPDGSLGGGTYVFHDDVQVPTLFSRARDAGLRVGAVSWPVTAGAPLAYNLPDVYPVATAREAKNLLALVRTGTQPGLLADLLPGPEALLNLSDELRGQVAIRFARGRPDLLVVHFLELDQAQHRFGPRSPEALAAVERIDGLLGALLDELRASGPERWEQTTVLVVSDHGFLPVKQQIHLAALLRTLGLTRHEAGRLVSWRAVAVPASGSAGIVLHPRATADDRRRVDDAVALLLSNPGYGVARAVRGPALAATGGFPGAHVVLEAHPGFVFAAGGETQPLVAPLSGLLGAHGYDPHHPEMRAAFVARGPNVRRGQRIGVIRLVDVAPTIARLLGLKLGQTEGRALGELFLPAPASAPAGRQ